MINPGDKNWIEEQRFLGQGLPRPKSWANLPMGRREVFGYPLRGIEHFAERTICWEPRMWVPARR